MTLQRFGSLIDNIFRRFEVKNCLVCVLSPMNTLFYFPVKAYCYHQSCFKKQSQIFGVNRLIIGLTIALNLIMCIGNINLIRTMIKICDSGSEICILHFADLIYIVSGILLNIFAAIRIKFYSNYLTEWALIINHSEKFGFIELLTAKNSRNIVTSLMFLYAAFFAMFPACVAIAVFFPRPSSSDDDDLFLMRFIFSCISAISQTMHALQFIQIILCARTMAENIKSRIEIVFCERALSMEKNFPKSLDSINKFFQSLFLNFKLLNNFVAPLYFVWFFFSMITLITNLYLMIDQWNNMDTFFMANLIFLQVRSYSVVGILIFMTLAFSVYDTVCNFLSFFGMYCTFLANLITYLISS